MEEKKETPPQTAEKKEEELAAIEAARRAFEKAQYEYFSRRWRWPGTGSVSL